MDRLRVQFDSEVEVPVNEVPSVLVPLLEMTSEPVVSQTFDVELVALHVGREDVFDIVSVSELQSAEVN